VIVVIHQAIGVAYPVIAFVDLLKDIEKGYTVFVVFIDCLAYVSSRGYVIYGAIIFYP
jgi:hypothetical protein